MSSIKTTPDKTHTVIKAPQLRKNRKSLLLLLFAFALPVIVAKLALNQQWLDMGVTNQGTLLKDELTLKKLGLNVTDFSQKWLILYALPEECLATCLKTLETVHNTYVVLGKYMPRVRPVALAQSEFTSLQTAELAKSLWKILPMPAQSKAIIKQAQVFIVDPLGNVILSHSPPTADSQLQASFGKAIVADMKKLLKYSKVG